MNTLNLKSEYSWIHCNKCIKLFDPKLKWYYLTCKHVYCKSCIKTESKNAQNVINCVIAGCGKVTKFIEIGSSMPNDMQDLFNPRAEHNLAKWIAICQFQDEQKSAYLKHLMDLNSRLESQLKSIDIKELLKKKEAVKLQYQQSTLEREKLLATYNSISASSKDGYRNQSNESIGLTPQFSSPMNNRNESLNFMNIKRDQSPSGLSDYLTKLNLTKMKKKRDSSTGSSSRGSKRK